MKLNNKGFSLVELMLAVLVSTIVLGAITAMIVFASKSSKETNARIELQNGVKDALNHMESHCMEAEAASWQKVGAADVLVVYQRKKDAEAITSPKPDGEVQVDQIKTLPSNAYAYWFFDDGDSSKRKSIYFGKCAAETGSESPDVDLTALTPDITEENIKENRIHLLAEDVTDFNCEIKKNDVSGKYTIDIELKAKTDSFEYSSSKTVYMRNQ